MVTEEQVQEFVRGEMNRAVASDFAMLRRIPSTATHQAVDYVSGLEPAERDALLDALVGGGALFLWPQGGPARRAPRAGNAAFDRFSTAILWMTDWKYTNVRNLRSILGDRRSAKPMGIGQDVPVEVLRQAESIQPTNASQIRKVVKVAFTERFAANAESHGGGDWYYSGVCDGRQFKVHIDYGGRSDQLRYEVSYDDPATGIQANRLTYEGMTGMGAGRWDCVTATNLGDAVTLLCELVHE
ncbi:MAG: hypothetical protein ACHRHE_13690, partial [Tepidisphaerales bacterium]